MIGFIPFPRVLVQYEMRPVSSRIWTRVAVPISYDDNHYTTGTYFMASIKPELSRFDYAICSVLEKKTDAVSHPNICSLKTPIEEKWNKMPEEFILKAC